jgi:pyruvate,water dikinase
MVSLTRKRTGDQRPNDTVEGLRRRLEELRDLVDKNNRVLELIARAGEMLGGEYIFDHNSLVSLAKELETATRVVVYDLNTITGDRYPQLVGALKRIDEGIQATLENRVFVPEAELVIPFEEVGDELADAVGEKMARLGELRRLEGCRVPDGFVVTSYACQRFLAQGPLAEMLGELEGLAGTEVDRHGEVWAAVRDRVREAEPPRELKRAIRKAVAQLRRKIGRTTLAVRSSAIGEDGELSFAGQYETVLGVRPGDVASAYAEVVASLFAPGVIRYRETGGDHPARGVMAVGCLAMVPARASGVVYTLDPTAPEKDVVVVVATTGLGRVVVEGSAPVDRFELERREPFRLIVSKVAAKEARLAVGRRGGVETVLVPEVDRERPALCEAELAEIAATALRIERYMKCPQDIEWAIDNGRRLFILQARPLRLSAPVGATGRDVAEITRGRTALMRGRGVVACRGIGAGVVHVCIGDEDAGTLPSDAVLVARTSSPRLAGAVARASAVITDIGTTTGHLAAIAREFRVPTIVDAGNATEVLAGAGEVTVDAEEGVVYAGRVEELLDYQVRTQTSFSEAPEFRLLRRMLRRIAPLNLKDPRAANFFPEHCLTYHDIVRFAHEKAMEDVAEGQWMTPRPGSRHVRRLNLDIPLDLIVVDLGGGLAEAEAGSNVDADRVTSRPLLALIEGLTTEGVWATGPADMDLDGFMASLTRSQALTDQLGTRPELNVAVVSSDYLNLSLRLGYHFNIVDCLLSEARSENYIYFRFAGGVTELTRRARRATVVKRILEAEDFVVEGKGDLVIARIKKVPTEVMVDRLRMVGRLIGFTRQLDVFLRDDELVERCVTGFLEGRYILVR